MGGQTMSPAGKLIPDAMDAAPPRILLSIATSDCYAYKFFQSEQVQTAACAVHEPRCKLKLFASRQSDHELKKFDVWR